MEDAIDDTVSGSNYEIQKMQNAHKNEITMIHNFMDDIQVQYDKVESAEREERILRDELVKY